MERSYQKKCTVMCELKDVLGWMAKRKDTNILVTREMIESTEYDLHMTEKRLNRQQSVIKMDIIRKIDQLRRTVQFKNDKVMTEMESLKQIIKKSSSRHPEKRLTPENVRPVTRELNKTL
jgi:hypothetical protein